MNAKGQVIVVVAILILVSVTLLALLVDGGRLYWRGSQARRAAQSAADAGMGLVAEQMVTLAAPRQTVAAGLASCLPDGDYGDESAVCTATPKPAEISHWLLDEDRQQLVQPEMRATVQAAAYEYAARNGYSTGDPALIEMNAQYPYGYAPEAETIRLRFVIRQRTVVLMTRLLGPEWVELPAVAISELPQQ